MLDIYVDEDSMHRAVLTALQSRGFDLLTTSEAGMRSAPDEEQLAFAASRHRILLTGNIGDFARLHHEYLARGRHHAGIVVRPRRTMGIGDQVEALVRLASAVNQEEMADRLEFLTNWASQKE